SFNVRPTTQHYTLSLHDALPISSPSGNKKAGRIATRPEESVCAVCLRRRTLPGQLGKSAEGLGVVHRDIGQHLAVDFDPGLLQADRKSTRLNSSHVKISYAVFCL